MVGGTVPARWAREKRPRWFEAVAGEDAGPEEEPESEPENLSPAAGS